MDIVKEMLKHASNNLLTSSISVSRNSLNYSPTGLFSERAAEKLAKEMYDAMISHNKVELTIHPGVIAQEIFEACVYVFKPNELEQFLTHFAKEMENRFVKSVWGEQ